MHRMRQMAPTKQFIAADPEAVCAYMKAITITGVRDSLAARPVSRDGPARHRRARARRDRPDGGAGPVTAGRRAHRRRRPRRGRQTGRHHRAHRARRARGRGPDRVPERRRASRAPRTPTRSRARASAGSNGARRTVESVPPGTVVGIVRGPLSRILRAERPMLNLLQRACGIASATRAYVEAVAGTALPDPPHPEDRAGTSRARRRRRARRAAAPATGSTSATK